MNRVLYIGGFGSGSTTADQVGAALENFYEDVEVMTFSTAMSVPGNVERAARKAEVVTHSAGRLALQEAGAKPEYVHTFNPPHPVSRLRLLGRTAQKSLQMYSSIRSKEQLHVVNQFMLDSAEELARHPVANLRPFFDQSISEFDGAYTARIGVAQGVPETVVVMNNDAYFKRDEFEYTLMTRNGVQVIEMSGQHDQLPLYPDQTVDVYFGQHAR